MPSKAQLDKLGDRLRAGSRDEADLRALDEYRRSFRPAYDSVITSLRTDLDIEATGRPAKTTASIVDKLIRQHIRLTQIQDIAGVRVLVDGLIEQDQIIERLGKHFGEVAIDDRRVHPSHGYRAIHVIVVLDTRQVEIQVRTALQHRWAEVSEKLADLVDPAIKYGGGPENARQFLIVYSDLVLECDQIAGQHGEMLNAARFLRSGAKQQLAESGVAKQLIKQADDFETRVNEERQFIEKAVQELADKAIAAFDKMRQSKTED